MSGRGAGVRWYASAMGFELNAVVRRKVLVSPELMILRVAPDGWELPDFAPGQYTVLGLPPEAPRYRLADPEDEPLPAGRPIRRAYSVASSSRAREYVEFYVTLVRSGRLTPRLFALEAGDRVHLRPRMSGTFTLDRVEPGRHVVLVATGTGLAPYMSMLRSFLDGEDGPRWAVLHGARHSWDLGYRAELETMERLSPVFTYLPVVSRPDEEHVPWGGTTGYVQDAWRSGLLAERAGFRPSPETTDVFLCGAPGMVESMMDVLAAEGFVEHTRKRPGQVHVERYW